MLNRIVLAVIASVAAILFALSALVYPNSLVAIGVGAAAFFGALAIIFFIPTASTKQVQAPKDNIEKLPEQGEQLGQQVREIKEAFNGWRAVPGTERLHRLLTEQSLRDHLAKAAELAKANRHREAIEHLAACLGPEMAAADRAAICLLMGNAYLATSQPLQAEAAYRKSLAAAEAIASTREKKEAQATALGNLGIIFRQRGELEKALEHYQKALQIHKETGHRLGEASDLGDLGIVFGQKDDLDEAREHFQKALEISKEIGNRLGEAAALNNLANVLRLKGNLKGALIYYRDALDVFRTIPAEREIALMQKSIAEVETAMKKQKGPDSSGKD
jgi:tetratricopeptide (TPR) repeat protein